MAKGAPMRGLWVWMISAVSLWLAVVGVPTGAEAANLFETTVAGANFEANWQRIQRFGFSLRPMVHAPEVGRGGPMPAAPGRHYSLSLSALSGTVLLCDEQKAGLCEKVPFHQTSGDRGLAVSGYWQMNKAMRLTLEIRSFGLVEVRLDNDTRFSPPGVVATGTGAEEEAPDPEHSKLIARRDLQPTVVPLPGAGTVFAGALAALAGLRRGRRKVAGGR